MKRATKLYSNVMKVTVLTCLFASASLSARPMSENQKMVLGNLRLSLWYQGLDSSLSYKAGQDKRSVEELERALMRYDKEALSLSSLKPKSSTKDKKQL